MVRLFCFSVGCSPVIRSSGHPVPFRSTQNSPCSTSIVSFSPPWHPLRPKSSLTSRPTTADGKSSIDPAHSPLSGAKKQREELSGDGGYVVVNPSWIGGVECHWENEGTPIAELPVWLLELKGRKITKGKRVVTAFEKSAADETPE